MNTLSRTALILVSAALAASTIACSSSTPEPGSDRAEQEVKASSPPIDPTTPDASSADASAACCDPATKPDGYYPEGISCCADRVWHESLGAGPSHTCAPHGGVGTVCEAAPTETCGGPPMTAFCAECPGGINGYKQIDGQPTCECCASTNDGKSP